MRPLILATLTALACAGAASAAGRYFIADCSVATKTCVQGAAGHRLYPSFARCQQALGGMAQQAGERAVCTGPGHPLPRGDHMAP